jgi:hypothetical protein
LASEPARTYLDVVKKFTTLGTIAVVVPLLALLAAAGWYVAQAWISVDGPPMPTSGYVAMILGVVFSLVVGCGLMALLFYSSRHGYDEPYRADDERD